MTTQPILPYGGEDDPNSGFSGSDTSEARAREADRSGVTASRQAQILRALASVQERGLTWREAADILGVHHGAASGALSNLHKGNRIARLVDARNRCKIYVLPEYVNGRATQPPKPNPRDRFFERAMPILSRLSCPTHPDEANAWCPVCRDVEAGFRLIRDYQREVQSQ